MIASALSSSAATQTRSSLAITIPVGLRPTPATVETMSPSAVIRVTLSLPEFVIQMPFASCLPAWSALPATTPRWLVQARKAQIRHVGHEGPASRWCLEPLFAVQRKLAPDAMPLGPESTGISASSAAVGCEPQDGTCSTALVDRNPGVSVVRERDLTARATQARSARRPPRRSRRPVASEPARMPKTPTPFRRRSRFQRALRRTSNESPEASARRKPPATARRDPLLRLAIPRPARTNAPAAMAATTRAPPTIRPQGALARRGARAEPSRASARRERRRAPGSRRRRHLGLDRLGGFFRGERFEGLRRRRGPHADVALGRGRLAAFNRRGCGPREVPGRRMAIARVLRQGALDHLRELERHLWRDARQLRRRLLEMGVELCHLLLLSGEWGLSREQLERHACERVDVGTRVEAPARGSAQALNSRECPRRRPTR